mgnify:CR=1 FL=1
MLQSSVGVVFTIVGDGIALTHHDCGDMWGLFVLLSRW